MEREFTYYLLTDALRKESAHVRSLAERLKTNHTTVLRRLKTLEKRNILEARTQGRNTVYSIKKSVEAQEFLYAAEHIKLITFLKNHPSLRRIIVDIQSRKNIPLAVIFGSYAKNKQTKTSDIDIYIKTTSQRTKKDIESLDSRLSVKIGPYLKSSPLIAEIEKNHIIIKGVEEFYDHYCFFEKVTS